MLSLAVSVKSCTSPRNHFYGIKNVMAIRETIMLEGPILQPLPEPQFIPEIWWKSEINTARTERATKHPTTQINLSEEEVQWSSPLADASPAKPEQDKCLFPSQKLWGWSSTKLQPSLSYFVLLLLELPPKSLFQVPKYHRSHWRIHMKHIWSSNKSIY